jgi:tight adherence protein C
LAAAVAVLAVAGLSWIAAAAVAAGWGWPRWRLASVRRRRRDELRIELPEAVDLLTVATASGLNLPQAVAAIAARGPPRYAGAFREAADEIQRGGRVAEAVEAALAPLGDPARPLAAALLGAARYGTAIQPALDRLAIESRQLRRRLAEEAARRVPVKLLFPLVLLVLPAFVLLTLVPLLAGALRSLPY